MTKQEMTKAKMLLVAKYTNELNKLTDEFRKVMAKESDQKFYAPAVDNKNQLNFIRNRIRRIRIALQKAEMMVG